MASGPNCCSQDLDLVRLRDRRAADHGARDARVDEAAHGFAAANAAADLQGRSARGRECGDRIGVALRARACAVEIHDVDERRAERGVLLEDRHRVRRVDGLGVETALEKPYAATVAQVDCRNELHQATSRKLASRRAPTCPERSGWNWAPWKFRCRTTAENSPP